MHLRLFIDHIHMFRSPSATIFRVYSIKEYYEKFVWRIWSWTFSPYKLFLLYSLILYALKMVADGDRNTWMWSINNRKCMCWFSSLYNEVKFYISCSGFIITGNYILCHFILFFIKHVPEMPSAIPQMLFPSDLRYFPVLVATFLLVHTSLVRHP
jgi:hypothetical protein